MAYDIVIGRDERDKEIYGTKGAVFLGKSYVTMGQTVSLSNNILLDVNRPHRILVCGKTGSGKSYSLSVIAEEIARLPDEVKINVAVLFFDTMGVFWTMKFPNERQSDLLEKWKLKPEPIDVDIYVPKGSFSEYKEKGVPVDHSFTIRTSELDAEDWVNIFDIKLTEPIGILIERIIGDLKETGKDFSIKEVVSEIKIDSRFEKDVKDAAENRFLAADKWGLFEEKGTKIDELIKGGKVSVLDISVYSANLQALVIGIISKKLLEERIIARKAEELQDIERHGKFIVEERELEQPMVWIMVDEAHIFLPKEGKTPATDALVSLLRQGRQPGISMILATQQPGEIQRDVLTQSDIVLSHRVTAKVDIEALNSMMQSYLLADIQTFLNALPDRPGSCIVLDDNSERIYPLQVHPKRSWHGGEAPSAIKLKRRIELGF